MKKTLIQACVFGLVLGPAIWGFNTLIEPDKPSTLFALNIESTNLLWCCIAMFLAPVIIDSLGTTLHRVVVRK